MSQLNVDAVKDKSGGDTTEYSGVNTAKAWVNFDGATVAIRSDYNVDSITDNGTGDHTVNFTEAMVDSNYVMAGRTVSGSYYNLDMYSASGNTTTSCRLRTYTGTTGGADASVTTAVFFGN